MKQECCQKAQNKAKILSTEKANGMLTTVEENQDKQKNFRQQHQFLEDNGEQCLSVFGKRTQNLKFYSQTSYRSDIECKKQTNKENKTKQKQKRTFRHTRLDWKVYFPSMCFLKIRSEDKLQKNKQKRISTKEKCMAFKK